LSDNQNNQSTTTNRERNIMASVNSVTLIGRLGKDPEQKTMADGSKLVTFSMAMSEQWTDRDSGQRKERVEWANISIWNEALAEVATKYLKKGSQVYINGRLETRSWGEGDAKRYATEIVLRPFKSELVLLDSPDRPAEAPARSPRREPGGRS
jgi:single-strand DNA-binding protein